MSLEEAQEYLMQLLQDANIPNDQNTVMLVLASLALAFDIDFLSNEDLIPLAEACQQQEQDPNVGRDTLVSSIALLSTGGLTAMGRFGLKIYNLMRLRGVCPPGSLVSYYKAGGKVCKKCVKKSTKGSKVSKDSDGTIEDYKKEYDQRAREYANLYRHLQSKSVGGAIDAQPKYSGKGPNGISKHREGGIIKAQTDGIMILPDYEGSETGVYLIPDNQLSPYPQGTAPIYRGPSGSQAHPLLPYPKKSKKKLKNAGTQPQITDDIILRYIQDHPEILEKTKGQQTPQSQETPVAPYEARAWYL